MILQESSLKMVSTVGIVYRNASEPGVLTKSAYDKRRYPMNQHDANKEAKDDLGRRLLAALMSYQLGVKSIDYTLKTYISQQEVDPSWGGLGWTLLELMNRGLAQKMLGPVLQALTDKIQ